MKKRVILVIGLLFLTSVLFGCESSADVVEADETKKLISDYSFFETNDSEEYLKFLSEIDCSTTYEIVSISNGSYGRKYTGPFSVYTVTYKVCSGTKDTNSRYEYFLLETENKQEYFTFLDELSDEYEIVDISTGMYAYQFSEPFYTFIVTYRKPV